MSSCMGADWDYSIIRRASSLEPRARRRKPRKLKDPNDDVRWLAASGSRLEALRDRVTEFRRRRGAAEIARPYLSGGQHAAERLHDPIGGGAFVYVPRHQHRREEQGRRI